MEIGRGDARNVLVGVDDEHLRVVWTDPRGRRGAETELEGDGEPWLAARLPLPEPALPGAWVAEAAYRGDLLERRSVRLQSSR